MSKFIPLSVPSIQGNEWKYIKECLDTEWVSSAGAYVERFEQGISNLSGAKHAVAVVNGTAALQIALRLVDLRHDDEVIMPTVTFIAPVNVIRYMNAWPIFMDCDDYYNIDVNKTRKFILNETVFRNGFSWNRQTDKRISAIVPVHVFGNAVDLDSILDLCQERNIKIVEDASESLGTYYTTGSLTGRYTGTIGHIGCYSFNGNKIITSGGGGMIVTNDPKYAERAKYLTTQAKDDPIRYIHEDIGYNFRLTNIQAAMGVAQLERLSEYIEIKKKNYESYKKEIDAIPGLHLAGTPDYAESNYWFYCLQINKQVYGKDREQLMAYFADSKIQARPIWHLCHLQKPYRGCQSYKIEKAFGMLEKTLNIPCSVNLTSSNLNSIIKLLRGAWA